MAASYCYMGRCTTAADAQNLLAQERLFNELFVFMLDPAVPPAPPITRAPPQANAHIALSRGNALALTYRESFDLAARQPE